MIRDIIRKIEENNGELKLLYSRPYENDYGYVEFSLKDIEYKDVILRIEEGELDILKFLLIYRIIKNADVELKNKLSNLIILDRENILSLVYKLKKSRVDLDKSIEDIVKYRMDDLVKNIIEDVNRSLEPIDAYSLIDINLLELDNLLLEEYELETFKKARYKIFTIIANKLIETTSNEDKLIIEESSLIKATILSLALKGKENLYYITKEIIREMTSYINEKIELNSEEILQIVKTHKELKSYERINNYDTNSLILDEDSEFYENLDICLFMIPFLYCEVTLEENKELITLEEGEEIITLEESENLIEEEEFSNKEEMEEIKVMENEKNSNEEISNEEIIIKEVEKFSKIIPSAKQMTNRYYNRRKEIIDSQFKVILDLFSKIDLERAIEVNFTLIEEVRNHLLTEGYELEENNRNTIIKW